ncbi:MAG TPA: 4Fe-4S dicluster domain-containing protein [Bacillota bacterium]|jgi:heterodisulfide reductase subunit C|nr:4Fe-4S dicluster domain-containing protein [Peptococcaceae bacterium MAG4]NLW37345.1 heterodisulfide reductase subunit C [Peptococcaceae bacterium]HPU35439.1 4Fe-4S dicluster domain-containing protein [Bacillota bacterium]HPZ43805.1 4Fe-4S dicluster domain-containing protein [Bacillota bacterium]HQD76307.1 4Fe-4S dicluster domain-containing protein [Bacillota bacterium]
MESINLNQSISKNADFIQLVGEESGQPVQKCYQCGKCTAGCPVAFAMDYTPNQVIRMVQLGMKDELLKSHTIWICASCSTCSTRCPCNVEIAKVMEILRIMAGRSGTAPAGKAKYVEIMYNALLGTVEKYGRTYEVGLVMQNNLKSGRLFNGADMGMPMLQRGKLKLTPSKVKGMAEIARIFSEARKMEGGVK